MLFHGINSVKKSFPWYFDHMLNDTRLDDLQDFGLNIVRLGSMWTGAEPEEGTFNETYLDILGDIVNKLASRGIYTILDMHQDVLSSYYNSYDGVPPWLIDYFPPPTNPYPWPLDEVIFWEQGYLTQACSEGFQFLYNNTEDAVIKWANFWVKMAETFKVFLEMFWRDIVNTSLTLGPNSFYWKYKSEQLCQSQSWGFTARGHIGTGLQPCHLWGSKSHRGECL